jgi:hypothetical protein
MTTQPKPMDEHSKPIAKTDEPDSEVFEASTGATCTFMGHSYREGAELCWGGNVLVCTRNGWLNTRRKC